MATHRYWRLLIHSCIDHNGALILYPGSAEVEFRSSIGGNDLCSGGTASACCSAGTPTYDAVNAFDNNNNTCWNFNNYANYGNTGHWLKYDFGEGNAYEINEIAFTNRSDYRCIPSDYVLQYSDNNSTWTDWIIFFEQIQPAFSAQRIDNINSTGATTRELISPRDLTSNTSHSPFIVTASSHYSSATWEEWHCFDGAFWDHGVGGQYWATNSLQTGWVKLDLGENNTKEVLVLAIRNSDTENRAPHDFTFQGSNDNNQWDTLVTVTDQTAWTIHTIRYFNLSLTGNYRYYKLDVTANNGDTFLAIGEIYLFGAAIGVDHSVITLKYRTGATSALCEAATYQEYTDPFDSEGFVQLRVEG